MLWLWIVLSVLLAVVISLAVYVIVLNNQIVRAKNKVQESLSSVDVYLKMRFDLVPNLVETVKGYAQHEKKALSEISKMRAMVQEANTTEEIIEKSNQGLPTLKGVFALAERYPQLKADECFKNLQKSLEDIEDSLAACRRFYNTNVNRYNNKIKVFPNNLVAKMLHHKSVEFFSIKLGEEVVPTVFKKVQKRKTTSKKSKKEVVNAKQRKV